MPIYEYYCNDCEQRFEELILEQKPKVVHCPQCGTAEVNRLLSLFATTSASSGAASTMASASSASSCGCGHCSCGHGSS